MTERRKDSAPPVRGSLDHLRSRTADSRVLTGEAQDRVRAILEQGRNLAPSAARDDLLRGIEMVHARTLVLNGSRYDELGKTTRFLLDVLMDHLKSGALYFDPKATTPREP